jgi:DNA-binding XRE family transcriptional regulator
MSITGFQLKAARRLLAWSQDDLAGACGVEVLTIVNFETGKLTPDRAINAEIKLTLESAGIAFATGEPGAKLKGLK